jgi:hypothetical protein
MIFIELVVLLNKALEDKPLNNNFTDKDLLDKDLPKVLPDKVFDAKFNPDW